jgi:hypothetical protein
VYANNEIVDDDDYDDDDDDDDYDNYACAIQLTGTLLHALLYSSLTSVDIRP